MSFHLYTINEIFSNADGTIQYIELLGESNGQNLFTGQTLRASKSGQTSVNYVFPDSHLSSETNGKSVLIATQGFADLGLVTPDYIIDSDVFLFLTGGTVTLLSGGPSMSYAALPTDGKNALDEDGNVVAATPRNFAASTSSVDVNGDPQLDNPIPDQFLGILAVYEFNLDVSAVFSDPDGDELAYEATLSNGDPLPAWITFNDGTLEFTGPDPVAGTYNVKLTAADLDYEASDVFQIKVISGMFVSGSGSLVGSAGKDSITGGSGNDTLNGKGAADTMAGGAGNDVYLVNAPGDVVKENASAGTDTARSKASSFALPANVEKLLLLGSGDISGTGNSAGNTLNGNAGANLLQGGGGADLIWGKEGADRLKGGPGKDKFLYREAPSADKILDFQSGLDVIRLDDAVFTKLPAGAVPAGRVQIGTDAEVDATSGDSNDRLKYETDTGKLFYDANGPNAGGLKLIATLLQGGEPAALDFSANAHVIVF